VEILILIIINGFVGEFVEALTGYDNSSDRCGIQQGCF